MQPPIANNIYTTGSLNMSLMFNELAIRFNEPVNCNEGRFRDKKSMS